MSASYNRRFKRQWRDAAAQYAGACWHTQEYRYWSADQQTKAELAETAMRQYRCRLSYAYSEAREHPKGKKALESVRAIAKELASTGLYLLSASERVNIDT